MGSRPGNKPPIDNTGSKSIAKPEKAKPKPKGK